MRFHYAGTDPGLASAAAFANNLTDDTAFWASISGHPPFVLSSVSPAELSDRMRGCLTPVRVIHFTSWLPNRWGTVAITDPNRPFLIAYHTRFLGNGVASKVNTLVHEFVHNLDFFGDGDPRLAYTHTVNDTPTRPMTAPYRIGWLAQQRYLSATADAKGLTEALEPFECDIGVLSDQEMDPEPTA